MCVSCFTSEVWDYSDPVLVLTQRFDIPELGEEGCDSVFAHLSLLADMRMECEQNQQLQHLLASAPQHLIGVDEVSTTPLQIVQYHV